MTMNSIYNDDLTINNSKKETNTMSSNSKTEQVSRTANETECDRFNQHFCDRRNWSHFYGDEATDYLEWCCQFRECGLTRLADRISYLGRARRQELHPAENADLELAEIALRNLSTQTTGQDDQQEDRASLQAAVDAVSMERNDWQNAALQATQERDELRALLAARNTEIDQLHDKVRDLERSVIYLANSAAYTKGLSDAHRNTEEMLLAERRMKQRCQAERQANENCPF
jgi:hypothetical protein